MGAGLRDSNALAFSLIAHLGLHLLPKRTGMGGFEPQCQERVFLSRYRKAPAYAPLTLRIPKFSPPGRSCSRNHDGCRPSHKRIASLHAGGNQFQCTFRLDVSQHSRHLRRCHPSIISSIVSTARLHPGHRSKLVSIILGYAHLKFCVL